MEKERKGRKLFSRKEPKKAQSEREEEERDGGELTSGVYLMRSDVFGLRFKHRLESAARKGKSQIKYFPRYSNPDLLLLLQPSLGRRLSTSGSMSSLRATK